MEWLQTTISSFRTIVLGHLSPLEAGAVKAAHHLLSNGWPGHDSDLSANPQHGQLQTTVKTFIAELASGNPKQQRAALRDKELQTLLLKETARKDALTKLQYFRDVEPSTDINLRTALQICAADGKRYGPNILAETDAGEAARKEMFPKVTNPLTRLEAARFCHFLAKEMSSLLHSTPDRLNDLTLKDAIIERYVVTLSEVSDDVLVQRQKGMEQVAKLAEPKRLAAYAQVLMHSVLRQKVENARLALKESQRAQAAQAERERLAQIAEERKRIEAQVTFEVKDETLDISLYGWPSLTDTDDKIRLFENIKAAFASATKVRYAYLGIGDKIRVVRTIRSMSGRQLALVKHELWKDRLGLLEGEKRLGELPEDIGHFMVELLNADGHANVEIKYPTRMIFTQLSREVAANWKADIDHIWFERADFFQKLIDSDTVAGDLIRWIVDGSDSSSGGWASSR